MYARHVPKSILGLATYRDAAYHNCPLAAKNRIHVDKNTRKIDDADDVSRKILATLEEHFDRVIYVLQKSIGIIISQKLAENLLDDYLAEEGYRYKYASLLNIPWMFAYMSTSKSIVGRIIRDEDMKKAILANVQHADFSGEQLVRKGKEFLQVNMYFTGHTIQPKERTVEESMRMMISVPGKEKPTVIYEKRIVFDFEEFQYLLEIPEGKGLRRQEFLDAARKKLEIHFLDR